MLVPLPARSDRLGCVVTALAATRAARHRTEKRVLLDLDKRPSNLNPASICLVCLRSATGDLRAGSITESRRRANSMLLLPTKQLDVPARHSWKSVLLLHTGCYSATCETLIPGPRCGSKPGSKPHLVEQGATLPAWLPPPSPLTRGARPDILKKGSIRWIRWRLKRRLTRLPERDPRFQPLRIARHANSRCPLWGRTAQASPRQFPYSCGVYFGFREALSK